MRGAAPSVRSRATGVVLVTLLVGVAAGCGRADDTGSHRVPARPDRWLPPVCIGVEPAPDAWSAEPSGEQPLDADPDAGLPEPELGAPAPRWALYDFQPQSCGHEAVYGLDAFRGRPTVVAIWSGS